MAMFLPPSISIDVWLFLEPLCEPPADAAAGDDPGDPAGPAPQAPPTPEEVAAASALAILAAGLPSAADAFFPGFRIVPSYCWHFENNAFSMPWQRLLEQDNDEHLQDPPSRPRTARMPPGADPVADPVAGPADEAAGADWDHP